MNSMYFSPPKEPHFLLTTLLFSLCAWSLIIFSKLHSTNGTWIIDDAQVASVQCLVQFEIKYVSVKRKLKQASIHFFSILVSMLVDQINTHITYWQLVRAAEWAGANYIVLRSCSLHRIFICSVVPLNDTGGVHRLPFSLYQSRQYYSTVKDHVIIIRGICLSVATEYWSTVLSPL